MHNFNSLIHFREVSNDLVAQRNVGTIERLVLLFGNSARYSKWHAFGLYNVGNTTECMWYAPYRQEYCRFFIHYQHAQPSE